VFSVDSSTKVAVVALIIMGLSASIAIIYPIYALQVAQKTYVPTYAISAQALTEEPAAFIHIDNPDQYVLQVTDNPNESVMVSEDDTQIIAVIQEQGTCNIEVKRQLLPNLHCIHRRFSARDSERPHRGNPWFLWFRHCLDCIHHSFRFKAKRRFNQKANEG
jgi:hypothetical protein